MKSIRRVVVLAVAAAVIPGAQACSIAATKEVSFVGKSAVLQAAQVKSLTNWFLDLRDGHIGIAKIYVSGYSIRGNSASAELAWARVAVVTELVKTLNGPNSVPVSAEATPVDRPQAEQYPETVIFVQPRCAATNSCCSGAAEPVTR